MLPPRPLCLMDAAAVQPHGGSTAPTCIGFADDCSQAARLKEAALLLTAGGSGELKEAEEHEAAASEAAAALQRYRAAGDRLAVTDSLRTIVHAKRSKVQAMAFAHFMAGDSAEEAERRQREILEETAAMVEEELSKSKTSGDKRCQAAMFLSAAEIAFDVSGSKALDEATLAAGTQLAKEVGDAALEASALLFGAEARGRLPGGDLKQALDLAGEALRAAERGGDAAMTTRAKALHLQGELLLRLKKDGMPVLKEALALYKAADLKRMQAFELHAIAKAQILKDDTKQAARSAKEAMKLCEEVQCGLAWRTTALSTLRRALLIKGDERGALTLCRKHVEAAKEAGDEKAQVLALDQLIKAHVESVRECNRLEATKAAIEGLTLSQKLGNRKLEADMWQNLAQGLLKIHMDLPHQVRLTRQSAEMCALLSQIAQTQYQELGEKDDEILATHTLVEAHIACGSFERALQLAAQLRVDFQTQGRPLREAGTVLYTAQIMFRQAVHERATARRPHDAKEGSEEESDWCTGVLQSARERLRQALEVAQEAARLFKELEDWQLEAQVWDFIASVQREDEELGDPVQSSEAAKALYQRAGDPRLLALSSQHVARTLLDKEQIDDAVQASGEALVAAQRSGIVGLQVEMMVLVAKANARRLATQTASAPMSELAASVKACMQPAMEAVALARKLDEKYLLPRALTVLSEAYCMSGNTTDGLRVLNEALEHYRSEWDSGRWLAANVTDEAAALLLAAEAHFMREENDSADERAEAAMQLYKLRHDSRGMDKVRSVLAHYKAPKMPTMAMVEVEEVRPGDRAAALSVAAPTGKGMDPEEVQKIVKANVMESIGGDEDEVQLDSALMDVGLDSLATVQFRDALNKAFGMTLPASLVFDYPSIRTMTEFLVEESMTM